MKQYSRVASFFRKVSLAAAAAALVAVTTVPAGADHSRGGVQMAAQQWGKPRWRDSSGTPARFMPQIVRVRSPHEPGTIIIDTQRRFLYLLHDDGTATRYGVGVGREGFSWKGTERISRKTEWPSWTPPAEMRKRQPYLPAFMPGGEGNPMGARALYLGSTLYRIHGTTEAQTIGQAVSSGCIRMRNEDVIDLYNRVGIGAKVVVF